jgi:hypothetical protein
LYNAGIYNTATGAISLTGNTIQNCSVYGTGASVLYGIGIQVVLEQWTLIPTK